MAGNQTNPRRIPHKRPRAVYDYQCLHCVFYHELAGQRGADWGVCFSSSSPYGGMLKFEHQGCSDFTPEPERTDEEDMNLYKE